MKYQYSYAFITPLASVQQRASNERDPTVVRLHFTLISSREVRILFTRHSSPLPSPPFPHTHFCAVGNKKEMFALVQSSSSAAGSLLSVKKPPLSRTARSRCGGAARVVRAEAYSVGEDNFAAPADLPTR